MESAYAAAQDVTALEMRATQAGVQVARLAEGYDGHRPAWVVRGTYYGQQHTVRLALANARLDESLTVLGAGARFSFQLRMLFIASEPGACRLRWDLALSPRTVSGRLMLPALRLARGRLTRRLENALARYVTILEAGYVSEAFRKGAAG